LLGAAISSSDIFVLTFISWRIFNVSKISLEISEYSSIKDLLSSVFSLFLSSSSFFSSHANLSCSQLFLLKLKTMFK
jgi:hypothetical protein